MENVLINQNKHWLEKPYPDLISRTVLQKLVLHNETREIQVLMGIRRSGKSTLFKLYINELLKKEQGKSILYINFDDPNYFECWKKPSVIYQIIEKAEKICEQRIKYLFLDEVQNVEGWEKFVKSVYDSEIYKKIFVTGSNSMLLQGNYATLLSGRIISHFVYPLSFEEILQSKEINNLMLLLQNKTKILGIQDSIMHFGSFPEVYKNEDKQIKSDILRSYFDTILLKDCIAAGNIRDSKTFREFAIYIISNLGVLYSYNSIAKAISSNDLTVKNYFTLMANAFLIYEINQFSFKFSEQIKSRKKAYCIDNGLISVVSERFSANKGRLFENLVFNQLIKNGISQIYYYNNNAECDFVVKHNDKLTAIQVCYELNNQNIKRETDGLTKTMLQLQIESGFIVTINTSGISSDDCKIVSFWELEKMFKT